MLDRNFFYRQILSLPPPPTPNSEKPRDMAFISSVPEACKEGGSCEEGLFWKGVKG